MASPSRAAFPDLHKACHAGTRPNGRGISTSRGRACGPGTPLELERLAAAFWYGIRADAHHAETLAAIAPRLRGAYRGCYRPPVPREAFGSDVTGVPVIDPGRAEKAPVPANDVAPAAGPVTSLRARRVRLLDRKTPRRAGIAIDGETLNWLGSRELAQACREARNASGGSYSKSKVDFP